MKSYLQLVPYEKMINISSNSILRGKWFVGSALMGTEYQKLECGNYYYFQDTIWSKVLNITEINPYWEIYNRTFNVLLINSNYTNMQEIITYFLDKLSELLGISKKSFCFVTSDSEFLNIIESNQYSFINKVIDFKIENSKVGTYSKLFIYDDSHFFPLIDFTHFKKEERKYFEISVNKTYIEFFESWRYKEIMSPKYQRFFEKYKMLGSIFDSKLLQNQDIIRFVSLLDCIIYLNKEKYPISAEYNGHIVKKILKELYFYAQINNYNILSVEKELNEEYRNFLEKEQRNYKEKYPPLVEKYSLEELGGTFGVSAKVAQFLKGNYQQKTKYFNIENIKFYTDIPFVEEKITLKEFELIVNKIIERKK